MAGCLKPATTETKDETEHGDAADDGYSDRGSTPLASTSLKAKEIQGWKARRRNSDDTLCILRGCSQDRMVGAR